MNPNKMFEEYSDRAKHALSPTERAVCMLGVMCAMAVGTGGLMPCVGHGYAEDWPDPRKDAPDDLPAP